MIIVLILFFCVNTLCAASFLDSYQQGDFQAAEKELLLQQVQEPFDPVVNYNLGNVQYKRGTFADARESFKKSYEHAEGDLKEHAAFNLGNSFYKNTLSMLGEGWEDKQIEDATLDASIAEVKQSIEAYQNALTLDQDDEHAATNKEHAEELLKKLEKKKEDQKNDDQQKQDENKDQNQDQNKDENKDNNEDQDNKNDQDKNNQDQKGDGQPDEQKQDQNQDQQKTDDEKKDDGKSDEQQEDKSSDQQQQQAGASNEQQQAENDMEMRSMKALLDSLDDREGQLHKALMKQHMAQSAHETKSMKNW